MISLIAMFWTTTPHPCQRFPTYVAYSDYVDEVENGNNECARFVECFMTRKGNKMVYWRDEESDIDYVSKVEE